MNQNGAKQSVFNVIAWILAPAIILTMASGVAMGQSLGDFSFAASRVRDVLPEDPQTGDEGAEFVVRFRESDGSVLEDEDVVFHVSSDRDTENLELDDDIRGRAREENREVWEIDATTNDDGEVIFEVTSEIPGEATIEIGEWDDDDREMIRTVRRGTREINFLSDEVTDLELDVDERRPRVGEDYILTVEALDGNFEASEDLDIIIEEEEDGEDFEEIETIETDEDGIAELRLNKTERGDFWYRAIYEGGEDDVYSNERRVRIDEVGDIDGIEAYRDTKFVEDGQDEFKVYFAIYDEYDNKVTEDDEISIEVTDPDGDTYTEDDREVSLSDVRDEDDDTYQMFEVTVDQDRIDLTGDYEIEGRVTGTTLRSIVDVTVSEFGELDDIELELSQEVALLDEDDDEDMYATVYLVDDDGLKKEYDSDDEDIVFTSDSISVARIGSTSGEINIRDGGETKISAYHDEEGYEDTATLSVSGEAVEIEVEPDIEEGNLFGEVEMTFIDEDGRRAIGEEGYRLITPDDISVYDEEDFDSGRATFSVEADDYDVYDLRVITDQGFGRSFELEFTEEEEEEKFDLTIVVEDQDGSVIEDAEVEIDGQDYETDMIGYAEISEIESGFYRYTVEADGYDSYEDSISIDDDMEEAVVLEKEEEEEKPEPEPSKEIIMNLDDENYTVDGEDEALEIAPHAIEGRTFLPFRAIGEALGAYVEYDESDQSVTAMRDDRTVVFYLEEKTAQVNDEDLEMDTAPFVDDDSGRTLLPIRFFAEAYDAYVDYDETTQEITIEE
ncbi:copper amine oxidase N-terminal domain-containing protein [Natranaerobius thermophilus]|uniref:Copper amine oxidase domain protein n=1 Tax=Natranaerobius thermophilus (strain ATCC BAA-1301 / DSM 18059 / JW/NM-WN-LF) TaxID=457570 RepID=B2A1B9_NATTJ|nr:copper amine oxidase N-terminal domain-containing protein [Natranaerobius thermophilus]ACB86057.1 copper amine oxidase domain protein [Natranaerobius thermophilus JW/NM-WN-LF]